MSDDGASWVRLPPRDDGGPNFGPGLLADGPAGVIGISDSASDDEPAVWRLGSAEAAASRTPAPAPTPERSTTPSHVPPMPSGVAFDSVSTGTCPTDPGELYSIDEEVVTVSWKAPRTDGVELRVYGITECFGTDKTARSSTAGACEGTPSSRMDRWSSWRRPTRRRAARPYG